jgi:two-component system, OmpR family, response regulator CpxR
LERILVIDDDIELCELVAEYLEPDGYQVETVSDSLAGLDRARSGEHALLVLDVMMPRLNGLDLLRRLRTTSSLPVLMLTARGRDVDRIIGLELGADDYLPKPFNPDELGARIRAILRRTRQAAATKSERLLIDDLELDTRARTVRRGGERLELTTVEFDLLSLFLRAPGIVLTREELSQQVLGREFNPLDRSIDTHVSNLRRKLGPSRQGLERIKSVRGAGYLYAGAED